MHINSNIFIETDKHTMDFLYANNIINLNSFELEFDIDLSLLDNNSYIVFTHLKNQIIKRKTSSHLITVHNNFPGDISPINTEQKFLADALFDDSIKMLTVTGEAGTGKTLVTMSAALHQIFNERKYSKLILTKPRTQVLDGDEPIGELPGNILEKMAPQLLSYESAINKLWGNQWKQRFNLALQHGQIQVIPLEFMRGCSFDDAIVICDEAQNVGYSQYKMLVTRLNANSKLICMGDTCQTDKNHTYDIPLLRVASTDLYKQSSITSYVNLMEVERGPLVELMIKISHEIESS